MFFFVKFDNVGNCFSDAPPHERSVLTGHCGVCMAVRLLAQMQNFENFIRSQKFQSENIFQTFLSNFDFLTTPYPLNFFLFKDFFFKFVRFGLTYVKIKLFFSIFFPSNFSGYFFKFVTFGLTYVWIEK